MEWVNRTLSFRAALCAVTAQTVLGFGFIAVAQSSTQDAVDDVESEAIAGDDEARQDVVVVTATRREAETLDLPLSITALGGEELVQTAKDDLADYIREVPGITFRQQSAGLNQISIRGVSGGGGQRAKAPISFYIDDVPVVSTPGAAPDVKTFDINRVEVLRGPQGTLFGESALGGVIRIISNQPNSEEFEARGKITYLTFEGGDDGYNFDGMINLPIVEDKLAVRAVFSRRDEGGWIDNIGIGGRDNANDLDYWSGRVTALWTVTPALDVSAMVNITRSDYGSRQEANENFQQVINFTNENRIDDVDQFNLTVNYDLGFAELTSSSNYYDRVTSRLFNLNFFNGFLPGTLEGLGVVPAGFQFDEFFQTLDIDDQSFNQEIRLVSPGDRAFRWVAGFYYNEVDNFVGVDFLGQPELPFTYLRLRRDENYDQTAVFGEIEYDISDQFTLVAGLRYTDESRTIR